MRVVKLDDFTKSQKPWEVEGVEWRKVRFSEIISKEKYQVGKVKVRKGLTDSGRIPVVDQSQELIRGYLNNEELKYKGPLPLIIFGDHTKVIKFIDFPFIVGADGVKILIPNKNLVCPKYFYWLLKSIRLPERGYARHFKFLKQATYLIPFRNGKPDLETQKKIVEYIEANFSRIDKILEKKKEELERLDELWESVLEQAFKPKEGEEWRDVRLGEVTKVIGGSTAPQNKEFYKNGRYLFVRVSDLGGKKIFRPILNTRDKLNERGIKENKLVLAPKNTIVFPKSGAAILTNSRGILGKEAYIVNHLAGVIAIQNKSYPRYLLFYLSKLDMGKYISSDSSYPSLKLETIKNLKIPLPFYNNQPDLEKQKEIANYLDSVYEKIKALKEKIQSQITQLEEMKESILEELFNCE